MGPGVRGTDLASLSKHPLLAYLHTLHSLFTDSAQRMTNASQVNGKWLYFYLFYSLGG